jgi:hypothetical protein
VRSSPYLNFLGPGELIRTAACEEPLGHLSRFTNWMWS